MQDSYKAHLAAAPLDASSQQDSSLGEKKDDISRCDCCEAVIPTARHFALGVSATPISCIVCGHQNHSSGHSLCLLGWKADSRFIPAKSQKKVLLLLRYRLTGEGSFWQDTS